MRSWRGFSPQEISSLLNEEILQTHVGDAAFLWTQRDRAVGAPHYHLPELARLDGRMEAHVEGLRAAGLRGWELIQGALETAGPGELFTAGVLAFESGDKERVWGVLELALAEPAWARALVSALGWVPYERIEQLLHGLWEAESVDERRLGIAGAAVHRRLPGPALAQALSASEPRLRARALKAAGELGRRDLLPRIQQSLTEAQEECRFAAAWSAARLGLHTNAVLRVLCDLAESPGRYARRALDMALRCMPVAQARDWCKQLQARPEHHRLAAIASGSLGDPAAAEELISLMANPRLARVAGESFSLMTGVDLAYEDLEGEAPEVAEPEEEELGEDDDLPWPAAEKVAAWWHAHRGGFTRGKRYLGGRELTAAALRSVLSQGTQRQRAAAALQLALREPAQPLFEVRAPGIIQTGRLAEWTL